MTADRLIAGRYRLTDPIGTGAMGVVWRATDVRLRRTVAVKQLLLGPGLSRSQAIEARMRAMREGRIAARLHHVNAVTVFDVAEEDGQPWLVMEYVNAPSLAAVMREKGPMPPTEVARIGAKVAAALAAAHDAGIVHRDVKPANILVAEDGTVKITDFGISRAVGDVTVTSTGFLAGTPAYLSPEVARGENPEPSSDVFALGSTLYAAVEGAPPFGEGDNPLAVLHSVARARVPDTRRAGPLGPVLMELLAAEADARPTMKQAHEALEAVAEGRGVPAHAHPNPTKVLPSASTAVAADAAAQTTVLSNSHGVTGNSTDPTMHVDMGTPARHPGTGTSGRPPSGPLPPVPRTGADGPRRDRRRLALAGLGVAAALLLAAVIATTVNRGGGEENPPVATGTSAVAPPVGETSGTASTSPAVIGQADSQEPSRTAAPTTTTAPPSTTTSTNPGTTTTTTTPTTTPPTTTAPTPGNVTAFVRNYYGMLPGDVSGAWSMLSPSYQAATGGFNSYAQFWGTIAAVRIGAVTPQGDHRAVVSLTYVLKNGSTDSENRWIQVDDSGGRMLITASGL
ncbi:serine/threonine-protein kinase [Nocardia sp. CC227C]|uniref:serine/threonine-protein kinase n=1 Tax=Nocardia sp. CC227C TaxID=3044562 RepID=UPI00278C24AF|nr:serine/threonine-protein kinase [Nocardia sp. CC227C]